MEKKEKEREKKKDITTTKRVKGLAAPKSWAFSWYFIKLERVFAYVPTLGVYEEQPFRGQRRFSLL